ncbi:hypothetical protein WICPIJ_007655 [Wickerhamomyces pijperi]|uniref:Uncharacterized protein n=1 Tax=Wickerhamomyces pijperi TaxID=599730 RepID=A0A9P8PZT8_WICPI|nr:hypothetical protein WICPIJ_007655 [Wickerhamomyces pijperi]
MLVVDLAGVGLVLSDLDFLLLSERFLCSFFPSEVPLEFLAPPSFIFCSGLLLLMTFLDLLSAFLFLGSLCFGSADVAALPLVLLSVVGTTSLTFFLVGSTTLTSSFFLLSFFGFLALVSLLALASFLAGPEPCVNVGTGAGVGLGEGVGSLDCTGVDFLDLDESLEAEGFGEFCPLLRPEGVVLLDLTFFGMEEVLLLLLLLVFGKSIFLC